MLPDNLSDTSSLNSDSTVPISADMLKLTTSSNHTQHDTAELIDQLTWAANHRLAVEVFGFPRLIVSVDRDLILGRSDSFSDYRPDIDLGPYDGQRMGVSRRHAVLRCINNELYLADLDSRNGTLINEHRIPAHTFYTVHAEDVITLGTLRLRLCFIDTGTLQQQARQ